MGNQVLDWLNADEVLAHFAASVTNARKRYRSFLEQADTTVDLEGGGLVRSYACWEETSSVRREHELQIGDERILGNSTFVQRVLETDEITSSSAYRAKLRGWSLEKLVTVVCAYFKIERRELFEPCRKGGISKTKGVITYFAMEELGIPSQKLAKNLGLTRSGVYAAKARGKVLVEKRNLTLEKL